VQFDEIVGWEPHLRRRASEATQADVAAAKGEIRPELYASINEAKWLVARITEQINRLSGMGDDQVASRLYSVITGA
jgi:putative heme iron utilization protein